MMIKLIFLSVIHLICIVRVSAIECSYCDESSLSISGATFKKFGPRNCSVVLHSHNETCKIKTVDRNTFNTMHIVTEIWLGFNELDHLDSSIFRDLHNLQELHLERNHLTSVKSGLFSNLKLLRCLRLDENRIEEIDSNVYSDLDSLASLNMSNNKIRTIDRNLFRFNTKLKILDLSINKISDVTVGLFKYNLRLEYLYLNGNQIKFIQEGLFVKLRYLQHLSIHNNAITDISKNAFPVTGTLWSIWISENQLEHFDTSLYGDLTGLTELLIQNNPWFCDCKLKHLFLFFKKYPNHQLPKCKKPALLLDKNWLSLNETDFQYGERDSNGQPLENDLTTEIVTGIILVLMIVASVSIFFIALKCKQSEHSDVANEATV